mgnify:FL=1
MAMTALAEPQAIKISSKRQITIPAQWYRALDFHEYALATWTDDGILIQPLDVADEDVTVDILRHLIAQGYEGDELIEQYKQMKSKIVSVKQAIAEAEEDVAAGRVRPARELIAEMRAKYGLYR